MALIEKATLHSKLAPPFDALLAEQLLDEFISLERRFILRDWEPAELDGGQFAEVLARAVYHIDSGTLNYSKGFEECIKYLETDSGLAHSIAPRHNAIHLARVLRTIYKFRSQRGAIHISNNYTANQMDAKLMVECARWLMVETLRVFSKMTQECAASAIRELLQFDVPCVGRFQDCLLVQRTDLSCDEEILVLLHYAGESGFTRSEVGRFAKRSAPAVTKALQKLSSPTSRQVILLRGRYYLTDLGSRHIRLFLGPKLLL